MSESSLRRFLWTNFDEASRGTRRGVLPDGDSPPASEEVQVQCGLLGRWFDPAAQRMRQVWGFIMVLTVSRLMFLRAVLRMDRYRGSSLGLTP